MSSVEAFVTALPLTAPTLIAPAVFMVAVPRFFFVTVITPFVSCEIVAINDVEFPLALGSDTASCFSLTSVPSLYSFFA